MNAKRRKAFSVGMMQKTEIKAGDCTVNVPDPSTCTRDLNVCGNPSVCACPDYFVYNPASGLCDLENP